MGKKTDKDKPVAAPAPTAKTAAKKPAARKTAAKAPAKPAAAKAGKPTFTNDDIALRAYFIAEKRHQAGIHGDAHQDWVEAEKQLTAESKKKAAAKKA